MKLKQLYLKNFGTFDEYTIEFPNADNACILLTGKNNAGKTTIIRALKLVSSGLKFAKGSSKSFKRELLKKDLPQTNLQRFIYRFNERKKAEIQATFDNDKIVKITLDGANDSVEADVPPHSQSMSNLFGFLPTLGQLAEKEELLTRKHILDYLDTSVAPHHFRNHLYQLINDDQYLLIKQIVADTWQGITLQDCTHDIPSNLLTCIYKHKDFYADIAWAGQGLQIWLQIVTHLVRLSEHPIIVFDEPEIFLHPQKQHDFIELIHNYYHGCAIVATHSPEMINSVDISHIIFVNNDLKQSTLKKSSDRSALDTIRRSLGSSFNVYVSQFEDVDCLLATEHQLD
jgi:predicted ATP-dependent endonuclease of OLD family